MKGVVVGAAALTVALLSWAEVVHWRASRRLLGSGGDGPEAVVVLGYRNADPCRANALNRWRVGAALRSIDPRGSGSRLVLCGGGSPDGGAPEAPLMAHYAVQECGYGGPVVLEERSRTTWENIENVVPLVEDAARIKIVSNPLHAEKARLYLHRQRPDLAKRLVLADDYRVGEWAVLKPLFAVYGLLDLYRTKRNLRDAT